MEYAFILIMLFAGSKKVYRNANKEFQNRESRMVISFKHFTKCKLNLVIQILS